MAAQSLLPCCRVYQSVPVYNILQNRECWRTYRPTAFSLRLIFRCLSVQDFQDALNLGFQPCFLPSSIFFDLNHTGCDLLILEVSDVATRRCCEVPIVHKNSPSCCSVSICLMFRSCAFRAQLHFYLPTPLR